MIEVSNLTKSYQVGERRHYVFRDVSFKFPAKTNIGILGPNGAGKSTLLRILGGIDHPDSGHIERAVSISWPLGLRGGFVGHMTGRENCRMVCRAYGLRESGLKEKIERIKELSGIGEYFEQPVAYYSSGMGGRLGFALSMAFDFDYFLIDEITSVGDAHFKALAKRVLDEKRATSNIVMVSHSMGDLKRFCDVAVLVRGGKVEVFHDFEEAIAEYLPKTIIAADAETVFERTGDEADPEAELSADNTARLVSMRIKAIVKMLQQPDLAQRPTARELHAVGASFIRLGLPGLALEIAEKALEEDPYHLGCCIVKLQALNALDRKDLVAGVVEQGLELDENHPLFNFERSVQLFREERFDEAAEHARRAVMVQPLNSQFWWQLARVQCALGEWDEALFSCQRGLNQEPPFPHLKRLMAQVLFARGEVEKALSVMRSDNEDMENYNTLMEQALKAVEDVDIPEEFLAIS